MWSERERAEFRGILERLERLRRELHLSQGEMARVCGVAQSTYSRWVNGEMEPHPLMIQGLRARIPDLLAELSARRAQLEEIFQEIRSLQSERR